MSYQNIKNLLQILKKPKTHAELTNLLSLSQEKVHKLLIVLKQQNWLKLSTSGHATYQLKHSPDFLDKKYIENSIGKFEKNCHIEIFDTIDSTNNYLLQKPLTENNKLEICLAEMQTNGKGRLNRNWVSPACQNIYMSLSLKTTQPLAKLSQLSLVVGLAIVKTLNTFHTGFKVKWPNDIYYNTKKMSGILIETKPYISESTLVVIGVGININMLPETKDAWSSLRQITGQLYIRNNIIPILVKNINNYSNLFLNNDFSVFENEWKKHDFLCNRTITVSDKNNIETGTYVGIDKNGKILLNNKNMTKAIPMHYSIDTF